MALYFLRAAILYVIVGMVLGIWMGINENFDYAPVHAHLNLVGWATMALFGLTYRAWPEAAAGAMVRWHFWIANIGAVLLAIGIFTQLSNMPQLGFIVIIGSIITLLSVLMFAGILYRTQAA